MRIVIDLQGAQAENRARGIGRYALAFAQAVVRKRKGNEVLLALSGQFPDSIEAIRAAFDGRLPQESIRVWHAPGPTAETRPENASRRQAAERVREAFLASLRPDFVHVCSLFEGRLSDAVTSVHRFEHSTPVSVTLYDLIPLIHKDPYLADPAVERWYLKCVDDLRRADLLFAISASAGREAVEHLGFAPDTVRTVGTDCDPQFQPIVLSDAQRAHLRAAYGVVRPYVMYTGGIDHRKNIEGLIHAYAMLPAELRAGHQLAIVCGVQQPERERLLKLARGAGLSKGEVVLTGYVPDEDLVALYNACALFVFPSWHEGFGLPALEAMRCGKAVIASNTSSLPEVIDLDEALFDPFDVRSIAQKLERGLSDSDFRHELQGNALRQAKKFNWDEIAQRAWESWESHHAEPGALDRRLSRPRLAYVSPLPPERSGIADYSAELLAELTRWYDVDVVVAQAEVGDAHVRANCPVRTPEEFRANAARYDRVLYHFGNSPFHSHMFALLEEVPGVVVLHDFFLSGVQALREVHGSPPHAWVLALLASHGYLAVQERYSCTNVADVVSRYPANLPVLQRALGIVVHSEYSRVLARHWYGEDAAADWAVIPHLRTPATSIDRASARQALGLAADVLLVCSFGVVGASKHSRSLMDAWLSSPLAADPRAHLVFVGQNDDGAYGHELLQAIARSGAAKRIRVTGWADPETFRRYLTAADIGVQLRAMSRGETSGTVLDCMNHSLATIVNAQGSMADLDRTGVWMLPDAFSGDELAQALTTLASNPERRKTLGDRARQIVQSRHSPRACAEQYFAAIESFYDRARSGIPGLLSSLAGTPLQNEDGLQLASCLALSFPPVPRLRQLLVDISEWVRFDARSGIQRVVRNLLREWLRNPPDGWRVEPVYATVDQSYRYARRFTAEFLSVPADGLSDELIDYAQGDVFFGLDLQPQVQTAQAGFFRRLREQGVQVKFMVYDLLCIAQTDHFVAGAKEGFSKWLSVVGESDGAVCISKAVADDLDLWMRDKAEKRLRPFVIDWNHLGAEADNTSSGGGLPADSDQVLANLKRRPSFLMVGTLEPRKGHAQVLDAVERLWQEGSDINLIVVGKQGWMVEALVERLRAHPERGRRLLWLEGISDGYLERIYAASTCLIAASYGEGFGLPLVEAARHRLPVIARDLPVFREVAGTHAHYFDCVESEPLAQAVKRWLALYLEDRHPKSDAIRWLTWKQSADQLAALLCESFHSPPSTQTRA